MDSFYCLPLFSCLYWDKPGQSAKLQSWVSVEFPGHVSFPEGTGLLHDRARNSTPGPQEAEHWDHVPQSSHSVTGTEKRNNYYLFLLHRIPEHLISTHSLVSEESPKHCLVSSWQVRLLTVRLSPHVDVQEDQLPHWCHSPLFSGMGKGINSTAGIVDIERDLDNRPNCKLWPLLPSPGTSHSLQQPACCTTELWTQCRVHKWPSIGTTRPSPPTQWQDL